MNPGHGTGGPRTRHPFAVVTGASRGLGGAWSAFLAGRGYDLVLTARHGGPLRDRAESLRKFGGEVVEVTGDVADPACRRTLRAIVESRGWLDLLVNNASELGPSPLIPLVEVDPTAFDRVFSVNVVSPVSLVRELVVPLGTASGLVINVTSDAATGAYPGWGVYGASKAALELISQTLAKELVGRGISIVSVDPGDMRTAMHQAAYPGQDISDRPPPEVTLPFFAWLLGQEHSTITGQRFRAQGETWEVAAT